MSLFGKSLVAVTALGAIAAVAIVGAQEDRPAAEASAAPTVVVFSPLSETYSSVTPADWATNADHIAEVTAIREKRGVAAEGMVQRLVTLQVDRLRWSRENAASLPAMFDMVAFGWVDRTDGLAEIAAADASRIEPGHSYVVALIRLEPRCNADDGLVSPGGWTTIGSGGAIPFDDGDLAFGEIEGEPNATVDGADGSMMNAAEPTASPRDLVALVRSAEPGVRPEQPGVREGC